MERRRPSERRWRQSEKRALTTRLDSMAEAHGKLAEQVNEIVSRYDDIAFGNHKQHDRIKGRIYFLENFKKDMEKAPV